MQKMNVSATVFRLKMAGTYVLTDDYYLGFIHPSERFDEPRLGEVVNARVVGLGHDGILNLSLKPRAFEAISDDAQMILTFLAKSATHAIPYTDKSNPDVIKDVFGISKGAFKRAMGSLLKAGRVKQVDGETILIDNEK
jgi:predicted RNA-binding protein (virulence factor B family)